MKDLSDLFFIIQLVYSFFVFFRGLVFLVRLDTRVYTKLLPQYQTIQKCAVSTKPIFHSWNKLKLSLGGRGGFHKHPGWCLPLSTTHYCVSWNIIYEENWANDDVIDGNTLATRVSARLYRKYKMISALLSLTILKIHTQIPMIDRWALLGEEGWRPWNST